MAAYPGTEGKHSASRKSSRVWGGKWIPWDESWYAAGKPRASGPASGVPGLFHGGRRVSLVPRKVRTNGLPVFFQVLPYLGSHEDLSWSPLEQIPSLFTIFQAVPKVAGPLAGSCPDTHPPTHPPSQPASLSRCMFSRLAS